MVLVFRYVHYTQILYFMANGGKCYLVSKSKWTLSNPHHRHTRKPSFMSVLVLFSWEGTCSLDFKGWGQRSRTYTFSFIKGQWQTQVTDKDSYLGSSVSGHISPLHCFHTGLPLTSQSAEVSTESAQSPYPPRLHVLWMGVLYTSTSSPSLILIPLWSYLVITRQICPTTKSFKWAGGWVCNEHVGLQ